MFNKLEVIKPQLAFVNHYRQLFTSVLDGSVRCWVLGVLFPMQSEVLSRIERLLLFSWSHSRLIHLNLASTVFWARETHRAWHVALGYEMFLSRFIPISWISTSYFTHPVWAFLRKHPATVQEKLKLPAWDIPCHCWVQGQVNEVWLISF